MPYGLTLGFLYRLSPINTPTLARSNSAEKTQSRPRRFNVCQFNVDLLSTLCVYILGGGAGSLRAIIVSCTLYFTEQMPHCTLTFQQQRDFGPSLSLQSHHPGAHVPLPRSSQERIWNNAPRFQESLTAGHSCTSANRLPTQLARASALPS